MPKTKSSPKAKNHPDQAAAGKGMPAEKALPQTTRPGKSDTLQDSSVEASLQLPHERDQALNMTAETPDPLMKKAACDVDQGHKDTSNGPEMDRAYKKL